jgi:hypothetical protein
MKAGGRAFGRTKPIHETLARAHEWKLTRAASEGRGRPGILAERSQFPRRHCRPRVQAEDDPLGYFSPSF